MYIRWGDIGTWFDKSRACELKQTFCSLIKSRNLGIGINTAHTQTKGQFTTPAALLQSGRSKEFKLHGIKKKYRIGLESARAGQNQDGWGRSGWSVINITNSRYSSNNGNISVDHRSSFKSSTIVKNGEMNCKIIVCFYAGTLSSVIPERCSPNSASLSRLPCRFVRYSTEFWWHVFSQDRWRLACIQRFPRAHECEQFVLFVRLSDRSQSVCPAVHI